MKNFKVVNNRQFYEIFRPEEPNKERERERKKIQKKYKKKNTKEATSNSKKKIAMNNLKTYRVKLSVVSQKKINEHEERQRDKEETE